MNARAILENHFDDVPDAAVQDVEDMLEQARTQEREEWTEFISRNLSSMTAAVILSEVMEERGKRGGRPRKGSEGG